MSEYKVSPLVWSIFFGQNADLTSGRDCSNEQNFSYTAIGNQRHRIRRGLTPSLEHWTLVFDLFRWERKYHRLQIFRPLHKPPTDSGGESSGIGMALTTVASFSSTVASVDSKKVRLVEGVWRGILHSRRQVRYRYV